VYPVRKKPGGTFRATANSVRHLTGIIIVIKGVDRGLGDVDG
jgi:hypothetical protein